MLGLQMEPYSPASVIIAAKPLETALKFNRQTCYGQPFQPRAFPQNGWEFLQRSSFMDRTTAPWPRGGTSILHTQMHCCVFLIWRTVEHGSVSRGASYKYGGWWRHKTAKQKPTKLVTFRRCYKWQGSFQSVPLRSLLNAQPQIFFLSCFQTPLPVTQVPH